MSRKWVDNEIYFGPDRRHRGGSKRWGDRRQINDAADPPPLGAALRRLRVTLLHASTPEGREHALQLANLAITEAERLGLPACANAVRESIRHIDADQFADAERFVMEAQTLTG